MLRALSETQIILAGELGGDPPGVSTRVFDAAAEVGVAWFLDRFLNGDAAGNESFFVSRSCIRHVDVEPGWEGGIAAACVGDHYDGVVDANFGVHDFVVGGGETAEGFGIECFFQEVEDALGVFSDDVDGNGIVGFRFPGCGHGRAPCFDSCAKTLLGRNSWQAKACRYCPSGPEKWEKAPGAASSKRVRRLRKTNLSLSVGPLRCLAMMISAMSRSSGVISILPQL